MQPLIRWLGTLQAAKGLADLTAAGPYRRVLLLLLSLAFLCGIGVLDKFGPRALDLTLFYLAGCAVTGWAAGFGYGLAVSVFCGVFLALGRGAADDTGVSIDSGAARACGHSCWCPSIIGAPRWDCSFSGLTATQPYRSKRGWAWK